MKKIILCLLTFMLIGCSSIKNNFDIGNESGIQVTNKEIYLTVKEGTLLNTQATFILKNDSDVDVQYGNAYELEIKQDGKWHKINVEIDFTMQAYELKAKKSLEFNLNWKETYGKLAKGEYRIIKTIDIQKEDTTFDSFFVAAEFTIK